VDAIEGRLRDTAKACISAYRGWRQQPSEATIQSLSDTVHELRKALARVEIDMSASRREEQAIRPIPIPAHRASRRPN
jgi:Meckel syndrome type 1 protein